MGSWSESIMGGDSPLDAQAHILNYFQIDLGTQSWEDVALSCKPIFERANLPKLLSFVDQAEEQGCTLLVLALMYMNTGATLPPCIRIRCQEACLSENLLSWSAPLVRLARLLELSECCASYSGQPLQLGRESALSPIHNAPRSPTEEQADQALHHALKYPKSGEDFQSFFRQGADPNLPLLGGHYSYACPTAFMMACSVLAYPVVDCFIEAGAHLEALDADGWTPAFYAVLGNNVQVLEHLLHTIDPLTTLNNGVDLLYLSTLCASIDCAQLLKTHLLTQYGLTEKTQAIFGRALIRAAQADNLTLFDLLVPCSDLSLCENGQTAWLHAARNGQLPMLKKLAAGSDIFARYEEQDALQIAQRSCPQRAPSIEFIRHIQTATREQQHLQELLDGARITPQPSFKI